MPKTESSQQNKNLLAAFDPKNNLPILSQQSNVSMLSQTNKLELIYANHEQAKKLKEAEEGQKAEAERRKAAEQEV